MKRILLAVLIFTVACGGSTAPESPTASGTWAGPVFYTDRGLRYTDQLSLALTETAGQVSGVATWTLDSSIHGPGGVTATPYKWTVTGTFDAPTLSLAIQGLAGNWLTGAVSNSGDAMTASVAEYGGVTVTLTHIP